jgi:hypothetical protein
MSNVKAQSSKDFQIPKWKTVSLGLLAEKKVLAFAI